MGVCGQYVLMQTLFMNRIEDFMKKIFRQIHLWLSVPFGLIISLISGVDDQNLHIFGVIRFEL